MLDGIARRLVDPILVRAARPLAARGVSPDAITLCGMAAGVAGALAVVLGEPQGGLGLFLAGRALDGLDGTVARMSGRKSDFGGYLDIVCDFVVYAAIPLAFAILDPAANALPAAVLLAAFYVNGASFLGFAVLAERRGLVGAARGEKSLYFTAGLAEGTETILAVLLACLAPAWFPAVAYAFAALCLASALARLALAARVFRPR